MLKWKVTSALDPNFELTVNVTFKLDDSENGEGLRTAVKEFLPEFPSATGLETGLSPEIDGKVPDVELLVAAFTDDVPIERSIYYKMLFSIIE